MKFINNISKLGGNLVNNKIKRYLREAEDFYLSYALLEPSTKDLYLKLRESYENLKSLKIT
jgi:predicted DNA-binding protein